MSLNTPWMALSWELWRKARMGAILLVGCAALALGVHLIANHQAMRADAAAVAGVEPWEMSAMSESASHWQQSARVGTVVLFCLSFLVVCALCTQVEPSAARGFTGIPSRMFTLPVSSVQLALIPALMGLLAVSVLWCVWRLWLFPRVFEIEPGWPSTYFWLLQLAWMGTLQAVVWGLPGYPRLRTAVLTAMVFLAVGGALAGLSPGRGIDVQSPWLLAGLATWTMAALGLAMWAVGMTRRGAWGGGYLWSWPRIGPVPLFGLRLYFDTPFGAQVWMECRRRAVLALGILVIWSMMWFPVSMFWAGGGANTFVSEILSIEWGFILVPWSVAVGTLVALDPARRTSGLGTFTASRPITTGEMVAAKLVAMIAIWATGLVWSAAFTELSLGVSGGFRVLVDALLWRGVLGTGLPTVLTLLVLSFNVLIGLLPLLLTGRAPGQPWAFLMVFPAYFAVPSGFAVLYELGLLPEFVRENLVPLALVAKVTVAGVAWARGLRKKVVGIRFVATWLALWVVASLMIIGWLLVSGVDLFGANPGWLKELMWIPLAVPLARIALSPLALAANRHR